MRRTLRLMAVLYLAVPIPAFAAKPHYELTGKVVKIADGDTLTFLDADKEQRKIRLAGIDAPEKGQPFRTKARESLAGKVFGQTGRVEIGITGKSGASFWASASSTWRWSATASHGAM